MWRAAAVLFLALLAGDASAQLSMGWFGPGSSGGGSGPTNDLLLVNGSSYLLLANGSAKLCLTSGC